MAKSAVKLSLQLSYQGEKILALTFCNKVISDLVKVTRRSERQNSSQFLTLNNISIKKRFDHFIHNLISFLPDLSRLPFDIFLRTVVADFIFVFLPFTYIFACMKPQLID